MDSIKKMIRKIEKIEDKNNAENEIVKNLLEYASGKSKEINYDLFKDIPIEMIDKAIREVEKNEKARNNSDEHCVGILNEMVMVEFVKDNINKFIPKTNLVESLDFF
jgi:uncharacterized membrane protein YgaE (UPF0421/DUF939 family)